MEGGNDNEGRSEVDASGNEGEGDEAGDEAGERRRRGRRRPEVDPPTASATRRAPRWGELGGGRAGLPQQPLQLRPVRHLPPGPPITRTRTQAPRRAVRREDAEKWDLRELEPMSAQRGETDARYPSSATAMAGYDGQLTGSWRGQTPDRPTGAPSAPVTRIGMGSAHAIGIVASRHIAACHGFVACHGRPWGRRKPWDRRMARNHRKPWRRRKPWDRRKPSGRRKPPNRHMP